MGRLREAVLVLALLLPGCGGGRPTGPSAPLGLPAGTTLAFHDGWTGEPVAGAAVNTAAGDYTTDASGQVTLARAAAWGSTLEVVAGGFLRRLTFLRSPREGFALWPTTKTPPDYVRALVYNEFVPGGLLTRWREGTMVQVVPSDAVRADPEAMTVIEAAVSEAGRSTRGHIGLTLGPGTGRIDLRVDPNALDDVRPGAASVTRNRFSQNFIVGGEIVLRTLQDARTVVVLHGLGHALGLGHSADADDVMCLCYGSFRRAYSEKEEVAIAMMYQRGAGTAFPDDDRASFQPVEESVPPPAPPE